MARRRTNPWGLWLAIVVSAGLHPVGVAVYEATRPVPLPKIFIDIIGEGTGTVLSAPEGVMCGQDCVGEYEMGQVVKLVATVGEGSTFEGWDGPCGEQDYLFYKWVQERLLTGSTYQEVHAMMPVLETLSKLGEPPPPPEWPLECDIHVNGTRRVSAIFGLQPDEVKVEWVTLNDEGEKDVDDPLLARNDAIILLPDPDFEADNLVAPLIEPIPDEMPIDDPEQIQEPEIVQVEPPPPVIPNIRPPAPAAPKPQPQMQAQQMKSVEVPDENEVEKAPDDATFLSDKNRDVAVETHAKQTNLEKHMDGEVAASEKSDIESEDVGAEEDTIRQLEDTEASTLDTEREEMTAHNGESDHAEGIIIGDEAEDGEEGEHGDDTQAKKKPGVLAMRGIEGRGMPGGPVEVAREVAEEGPGAKGPQGDGGKRGRRGMRGRRGIKVQLDVDDYERIVGTDVAAEEVQLAQRKKSKRRGRWEKKLGAIKSSLENFTPEVRPGNQTALKTRAAPFAVYIARMHRRIHELWGFGFLEDLDDKSATHEMNDWSLWTKIEIVINPDGTVDKTMIVKPSGALTFDVAALDTIYTGGPYEPPPEKIRSADGKAYMHWAFHRDWRQCGTFGVQPFILTTPRSDKRDKGIDDGDIIRSAPRRRRRGKKKDDDHARHRYSEDAAAATARATANMPTPNDPKATHAANLWLTGFTKGDVSKMVKVSATPFSSGGSIVASSAAEVKAVYKNILSETKNRRIRQWKILSAAGYRKKFGSLPAGIDASGSELFLVVRVKGEQFTLVLKQGADNIYKVTGFHR